MVFIKLLKLLYNKLDGFFFVNFEDVVFRILFVFNYICYNILIEIGVLKLVVI